MSRIGIRGWLDERFQEWETLVRRHEGGASKTVAARRVLADAVVVLVGIAVIAFIVILALEIL